MFLVSVAFDFPSEVMSRSWSSSDPVITERRSDCESAAASNRVVFMTVYSVESSGFILIKHTSFVRYICHADSLLAWYWRADIWNWNTEPKPS